MSNQLTHLDEYGKASMVNISSKTPMLRTALAEGLFCAKAETIDAILRSDLPKGEALAVARVSGIQAAKQCGNLIPLCHPLPIEYVDVQFKKISDCTIRIRSTVVVTGRTGIEMEALTAVSVSALTLWDMTKAIDDSLVIKEITLVEKTKELVD
jgi:cyclic pyranopterin phosphate synthase|tara:strand:- start:8074 stop:8535 length:462 start_codon:yes stop_codon:yes gene_type:complete